MPVRTFELKVTPSSLPETVVITPNGPLILENLFIFQDAWRGARASTLIFDLSGVNFIDSSAIGSLVNAHVSCTNRGRTIAIAGATDRVKQSLVVTRVDKLFKFYADVPAAEGALHPATVA